MTAIRRGGEGGRRKDGPEREREMKGGEMEEEEWLNDTGLVGKME